MSSLTDLSVDPARTGMQRPGASACQVADSTSILVAAQATAACLPSMQPHGSAGTGPSQLSDDGGSISREGPNGRSLPPVLGYRIR